MTMKNRDDDCGPLLAVVLGFCLCLSLGVAIGHHEGFNDGIRAQEKYEDCGSTQLCYDVYLK